MYGVDLEEDPDLLSSRSWRWVRVRVQGLIDRPDTRLARFFAAPPQPAEQSEEVSEDGT